MENRADEPVYTNTQYTLDEVYKGEVPTHRPSTAMTISRGPNGDLPLSDEDGAEFQRRIDMLKTFSVAEDGKLLENGKPIEVRGRFLVVLGSKAEAL